MRPSLSLKEVIQPHLPVGLPCYDFIPVISLALDASPLAVESAASGKTNSHDVTAVCTRPGNVFTALLLTRHY